MYMLVQREEDIGNERAQSLNRSGRSSSNNSPGLAQV